MLCGKLHAIQLYEINQLEYNSHIVVNTEIDLTFFSRFQITRAFATNVVIFIYYFHLKKLNIIEKNTNNSIITND